MQRFVVAVVLFLSSLPLSAQIVMRGGTIVAGGSGGGCGADCAYTNTANIFTQTNTFPALTVTNGVNGLPLYENTGIFSIGLGVDSTPVTATGGQSIGIGDGTNQVLTSGYDITSIGVGASGSGTTIAEQTAIGTFSCQDNVSGYGVTCIGSLAGADYLGNTSLFAGECADCDLVTGDGVVALGASSGCGLTCNSGTGPISAHSHSIFIGFQTGSSANNLTNQLLIGDNIQSAQSNYMQLGNSAITSSTIYGIPTFPSLSGSGCMGLSSGAASVVSCGGSQVYPGAGVANSTGSAWGTSYAVGTAANDLVQLNGSAALPAVSGANLTALTAANISSGTAGINISGNAALALNLTGSPAITVSNLTDSALTSGDCVQATTGGLLVTTGAPCGSGGGGSAFSVITSGTNSAAAMLVGTGASLGVSGSGTITATGLAGGTASSLAGFNGSSAYTDFTLGTGLAFSGSTLVNTGITGTLSTTNCIPVELTSVTIDCSLATDNGTVFSISDSGGLQVSSSLPGSLKLGAGTGTLATLGANTYAEVGPVTGGTSYYRQHANAAAAGFELWSTATIDGQPGTTATMARMEFPIGATGAWAYDAAPSVLAQNKALNAGRFISLTVTTSFAGCSSPPTFNVFDWNGTTLTTGTAVTANTTAQAPGTNPTPQSQTLPISAGDYYGVEMTNQGGGGGGCPADLAVYANVQEPQ